MNKYKIYANTTHDVNCVEMNIKKNIFPDNLTVMLS